MDNSDFWLKVLTTDYGFEDFYRCLVCGAIVEDTDKHIEWHQEIINMFNKKKDYV